MKDLKRYSYSTAHIESSINQDIMLAISTPYVGAVSETFIKRQIQNLAPSKTVILTAEIRDISGINDPVITIPFATDLPDILWKRKTRLFEYLKEIKITHILVEYGCHGTGIVELNDRRLHLPIIIHFHGFDASQELLNKNIVDYYRWMWPKVAGIITVSKKMKDRLARIGIPEEMIEIIPYGVEIPETKLSAPEKLPCKMIAVSRLEAKKGIIYLLKAFMIAKQSLNKITLDIIGEGSLRSEIEKFIMENNLGSSVTLHGAKSFEFVKQMLNSSNIFVQHSVTDPFTGDREGLPNSILEASAAALPVISTLHEGIPDAIEHSVSGYLVNEFDVNRMAEYMIELALNPSLRKNMGEAGRNKIFREFNVKIQISKLRKFIINFPNDQQNYTQYKCTQHCKTKEEFSGYSRYCFGYYTNLQPLKIFTTFY